jgi:hypothetical protein
MAVTLAHTTSPKLIARLTFEGAARVATRLADFTHTAADDRGRVAVLDLRTGTLLRDLRVS